MLTFATDISATTVNSLNVLVPMKWYRVFPLHEKRDMPSGITPLPCVPLQISKQETVIIIIITTTYLHSQHSHVHRM